MKSAIIFVGRGLMAAMLLQSTPASGDVYSWDFLTEEFDNISLTPFGAGAVNLVRPTDRGLRLVLPVREKTSGIGFATRFQLRGDFKISVRYRIEHIEKPTDGWGAGPSVYLTTISDLQPAAQLGRLSRADDREIYAAFRALPVDGERSKLHRQFDTTVEHGTLQLSRVGDRLTWAVAEGYSKDFEVLHEDEFDTGDVGLVRVCLQQSHPTTGGSVLIEHLGIIADGLPHLPSTLAQDERMYLPRYQPEPIVRSRRWIAYLACALVLASATGHWFIRRRRNGA